MESYQNARIAITHVCFIALLFAEFPRKMFEHSAMRSCVQAASLGPGNVKASSRKSQRTVNSASSKYI